MVTLTIFTPCYNRSHTLPRTYESLCRQSYKDFLWLIIDDGSQDGTRALVEKWMSQNNGFEIRYHYKENGGMHTAHNLAYRLINTVLNTCIDSDDAMPPDAVENILKHWNRHASECTCGMIALDSDFNGNIIGTKLPKRMEKCDDWVDVFRKYHITGDKKFIWRTSVMQALPEYPEFSGEKITPLSYKYRMVTGNHEMLLHNQVVCWVEYQPNGSSATIYRQYLQSPKGFAVHDVLCLAQSQGFCETIKRAVHYVALSRIARNAHWFKQSPRKIYTLLALPMGLLFEAFIRLRKWLR